MFSPPMTIQQASKRLYGAHPAETYKVECCAYEIIDPKFGGRQCFRRRGHGPAGLYCHQHATVVAPIVSGSIKPGSKEQLDALSAFFGI